MYSLEFEPAAFKLFKKLPLDVKQKIAEEAKKLENNPLAGQPLKGKYNFLRSLHFSYKGSAYRIIYQVVSQTTTILVRLATTRENIYRKLGEMKVKLSV
jgi:mRNA-degrading endonuclease RelE of RelBE toxin-antitoxin system